MTRDGDEPRQPSAPVRDAGATRAFVLSGGASLGAIQVGVLQAASEREIAPDVIIGTSAGASNGAFIASLERSAETARALGDVWRGLRRGTVLPHQPAGRAGRVRRGQRSPRAVRKPPPVDRAPPRGRPTRTTPRAASRDRDRGLTGQELRLSSSPAVDAVLASAAIPGAFAPVPPIGERQPIDGGVANNTPISHAIEPALRRSTYCRRGRCPRSRPSRAARWGCCYAMSALIQQRLLLEISVYRERATPILPPPPCTIASRSTSRTPTR